MQTNLQLWLGLRRQSASLRLAVVCLLPMTLAPVLLTGQWGQTAVTLALGYISALACLWRYRAQRRRTAAWLWIAVGIALNATGSLCESIQTHLLGVTAAVTPADALYLGLYPCVTVGLLLLVRLRYPGLGPAKLIDASVLTIGLGLLCWIYLIEPAASATGSTLARVVAIAYPVGDLMLLAILSRVMAARGWQTPAVRLMLAGILAFLLGDSAWALVNNNGWATSNFENTLLIEPFLAAYVLFGAAALHRSAGELLHRVAQDIGGMSWLLLGSLTLASLIAPAILVAEAIAGRVTDGIAIAICSAQLMLLVIARMTYLLRDVQRQASALRDLALEDALTGLPNRRALRQFLSNALERARRDRAPVSVAMLDLDHFKRFNDEYGHLAGDQLLRVAAAAWSSQIRAMDLLARTGGEEFVLILPGAPVRAAKTVVEKLRANNPLGQTFSAGVAEWDREALPDELIDAADAAMYLAKRSGRNQVVTASPTAVR